MDFIVPMTYAQGGASKAVVLPRRACNGRWARRHAFASMSGTHATNCRNLPNPHKLRRHPGHQSKPSRRCLQAREKSTIVNSRRVVGCASRFRWAMAEVRFAPSVWMTTSPTRRQPNTVAIQCHQAESDCEATAEPKRPSVVETQRFVRANRNDQNYQLHMMML